MPQNLKYNGKETQTELDLQWLDYGARMYQPDLGRFLGIDSKSEAYVNLSPYSYVSNSPVNNLDINGDFILPQKYFAKYERLTQYLQFGIQGLLKNKRIVRVLKREAGFTDAQLKETFAWDRGAKIRVGTWEAMGDRAVADFNGVKGDSWITLNEVYLEKLEKAVGRERDYYLFLIAASIIHETAHYGRTENFTMDENIDYLGEEGSNTEQDIYGNYIGLSNMRNYVQMWLHRQKEKGDSEDEDSENSKKQDALRSVIRNFSNLPAGTYIWNGSRYVKNEQN